QPTAVRPWPAPRRAQATDRLVEAAHPAELVTDPAEHGRLADPVAQLAVAVHGPLIVGQGEVVAPPLAVHDAEVGQRPALAGEVAVGVEQLGGAGVVVGRLVVASEVHARRTEALPRVGLAVAVAVLLRAA